MHTMFDNKSVALTDTHAAVTLGEGIPEAGRVIITDAINKSRAVVQEVGDFARRSLHRMVLITAEVLAGVEATEGLSKDAAFTALSQNVPGLSKSTIDKWGQTAQRLIAAGLAPEAWTPGAASAAYTLTGAGYGDAKNALKGVSVESSDQFVDAVAEAINSHPRIAASKPEAKVLTVADVIGESLSAEAFAESVRTLLDNVADIKEARKTLRALVSYEPVAASVDA